MERTTISDLPVEIFIKIFEKLESPEIFKVAEVCRHWYLITQRAAIVSKTIVKLVDRQPFNSENIDFFLNSSRKFQFRLTIHRELPDNYCQFIQKFYENIIELSVVEVKDLPSLEHLNIKCLKSLRNLEFHCCKIPLSLTNFTSNIVNLKNLKGLTLHRCSFKIESILPDDLQLNLTSLKLAESKANVYTLLSSISSLENLFVNETDSNSIETIFKYLKNSKLTKSLTELKLNCGNNDVLDDICQMNHLNLKKLTCSDIFNAGILEKFLSNQMNLETLISIEIVVNDKMLQCILKNLLNLQELRFWCWHVECEITDFGITGNPQGFSITRLEKLKVFSLYNLVVNITNASIRLMESMKHLEKVELPKSQNYSSNDSRFMFFPRL